MQPFNTFPTSFNVQTLYPQYIDSKITALTPVNMNPHSPGTYELTLLRFQAFKMMQHKAMLAQNKLNDIKQESGLKSEEIREKIESDLKTENSQEQTTQLPSFEFFTLKPELSEKDLKGEIQKLLRFLLSNMGKENEALLDNARNCYLQNSTLLQIYDKLRMKYYSAKKCKEDIIRYILRKAFRSIRTSIMKEQQISSKKASLLLCKRHFYHLAEQLGDIEKFEDEDQLLESLMPFNKNSKNKTMNLSFVLEIFTSQSFCEEYQRFLPEFNRIVVEEHQKKEEKLVNILVNCVQKDSFSELKNIARLPWTDVWIEDAKNIAIGIMPNKRLVYNYKKPKV